MVSRAQVFPERTTAKLRYSCVRRRNRFHAVHGEARTICLTAEGDAGARPPQRWAPPPSRDLKPVMISKPHRRGASAAKVHEGMDLVRELYFSISICLLRVERPDEHRAQYHIRAQCLAQAMREGLRVLRHQHHLGGMSSSFRRIGTAICA